MSALWLIILLIYGGVCGYAQIPTLCWWLLLPFVIQDTFDVDKKHK